MEPSLLGTKVARRILGWFVLCAVLPITALAIFTDRHVSQQAATQARERLEHASKEASLLVFRRLQDLETQVRAAADRLTRPGATSDDAPLLRDALTTLVVAPRGQPPRFVLGQPAELPPLPPGASAQFAAGRSVLVFGPGERPWLARPLAGRSDATVVWAEPTPHYVWATPGDEAPLAPGMGLCVVSMDGAALHCAPGGVIPDALRAEGTTGRGSGFVAERRASGPYLAAWRSLFLGYSFLAPDLVVVVSQPRAMALQAVAAFRRTFLPFVLLTLWLVLLLVYIQVRRTTRPLGPLQAGTRRLAALDFSNPVSIASGDEFEDLADAFNQMAGRLQGQFAERDHLTAALRDASERLHVILETAADAVVTTDADGMIEDCNRTAEQLFGYDRAEVVGRHVSMLLAAPSDESGAFRPGERHGRRKDGSLFPIELAVSQARLGDRVIHTGFARDISARKRAEAEREHLEAQLRQAQKMETIGTLAGGIAHDFNNILTAVMGYLDLALLELPEESDVRADLLQVRAAAERAKGLVRQILMFSRKAETKPQSIALAAIVAEVRALLRASLPSTIGIHTTIDPEAPVVFADPTQIHQVLMNLGTNAYHAMRATGGQLELTVSRLTLPDPEASARWLDLAPGTYARITVRDSGHGMDQTTLNRMFEPFFTTKPVGEGTGLGLSVVHGIVASHGGAITVDSALGAGTAFTILLPAAPGEAVPAAGATDITDVTGRGRVLVVDDDPAIARLAKRALDRLGYSATAETSSREALALVNADPQRFDLVITDLTMPGLTGVQLVQELLRVRPDLPVLLATGYTDAVSAEQYAAWGFRGRLEKPIGLQSLGEAVRAVLHPPTGVTP